MAEAIRVFLALVTLPAAAIGHTNAYTATADLIAEAIRMGFAGAALLAASVGKAHAFSAGAELVAEAIGVSGAGGGHGGGGKGNQQEGSQEKSWHDYLQGSSKPRKAGMVMLHEDFLSPGAEKGPGNRSAD